MQLVPVRRDDRGVTLIEVIMAVVILGIIIVPLTNALIVVIRNTNDVNRRLNESHDMQIATAYFAQDVQSIGVRNWASGSGFPLVQSIEVNAAPTSGLYPCGPSGTPNAIIRFAWDDPQGATSDPDRLIASYVIQVSGGERQLRRLACRKPASGSTTLLSNIVLAHNVDPTYTPTAGCPSGPSACTTAPAVPLQVTLTFKVKDPASTGTALTVVLSGQRRQT